MKINLTNAAMICLLVSTLIVLFWLMSMKNNYEREKYSTFECGLELMSKLRLPFSLHFYFVSIIFLIFDVEIMLILPLIFCIKISKSKFTMIMIMVLMLVLVLGFCYEWWTGLLSWLT